MTEKMMFRLMVECDDCPRFLISQDYDDEDGAQAEIKARMTRLGWEESNTYVFTEHLCQDCKGRR